MKQMSHNILPGLGKRGCVVLFALCAILGLMCPDSLSAQNSGEPTSEGVHLSKSATFDFSTKQGELKLEAFVEGETRVIHKEQPMDVVLVMDMDSIMKYPLRSSEYIGYHIKVFVNINDLDNLDKTKPEGYYACVVGFEIGDFIDFSFARKVKYIDGHWRFYSEYTDEWTRIDNHPLPIIVYKSKLGMMMDAAEAFVSNVLANPPETAGMNHQIAIATFSGSNGAVVQNFLPVTSANVNTLKTEIKGLRTTVTESTSCAGGLNQAISLFNGLPSDRDSYKVAIMLTGVEANKLTQTNANAAISTAYTLKNVNECHVYSIGLFNETPANNSNLWKYMNGVSSNYPNAQSLSSLGTRIPSGSVDYYKTVTTDDGLNSVFQTIFNQLKSTVIGGGSNVDLKADSYLLDVISEYFSFIGNASGVGLKYVDCTNYNQSTGEFTFSTDEQNPTGVSVNLSEDSEGRDVVKITGWNYSNYWCGYNASTGRVQGRKLIVTIPFILKDYSSSPSLLETNTTDSGIYGKPNGETDFVMVEPFEMPKIPFASLSVKLSGLKSGDASRFKVSSDSYSLNLMLRGVDDLGSDVIQAVNRLKPGSYTVTESSWAWGYTPVGSTTQTKALSETTQDNVFPFELTQKSDAPKHDEASKPNVMNKSN